jgi:serine/threonine-protein kinase
VTKRSLPRAVGEVVGERFELLEELGDGLSGKVYRARDLYVGAEPEIVAVKILHRELQGDRQVVGRFRREASILTRLEGPHIARLFEVVDEDDLLLLSLEYIDGPPLDAYVSRVGPLAISEVVALGLQLCDALEVAHAAGVVHRDLKPSNLLVEGGNRDALGTFEESLTLRVVDFGLAKLVAGEGEGTLITERNMVFGTPDYMAPEQVAGEPLDGRVDIYAAGVILYWLLVGDLPFVRAGSVATMQAHLAEEARSPRLAAPSRGLSAALESVVMRALAKSRDERFSSVRALAEALGSSLPAGGLAETREQAPDTEFQPTAPGVTMPSLGAAAAEAARGARVAVVMPEGLATTQSSVAPHSPTPSRPRDSRPSGAGKTPSSGRDGPPTLPAGTKADDGRAWTLAAVVIALVATALGAWLGLR